MMWVYSAGLVLAINQILSFSLEDQKPILYYYGIEESERGLAACAARQACGIALQRYWRAPAQLRLCACAHRAPCPGANATIPLNNRAHFQFCESVSEWEECGPGAAALSVEPPLPPIDPDEIEAGHHRREALRPPAARFRCRCREPNYWRARGGGRYACEAPPPCRRGARCGAVSARLLALHQACLCPRAHMCVHAGGPPRMRVRELLYAGRGYRAYCQPIDDAELYDEY